MTEDEAKKKWCPMVRGARREYNDPDVGEPQVFGGTNTDSLGGIRIPAYARCVASNCAMWRRIKERVPGNSVAQPWEDSNRGYCGLGGKP